MIIQKITIKNFRSYYGSNTFDFSNGLTLIIGDNGDGKTTFFESLQWLFNTTIDKPSIDNFSEMRKSELEIGEFDEVSVSVYFEHDGAKIIERRFQVERTDERNYYASKLELVGYEDRDTGRVQVDGKNMVTRCFDAFLQKFSMFKGETELNVFNDSTAFQQLVAKFSDLKTFDKYVELADSFESKSKTAYTKEAKSDEKISKQVDELDKLLRHYKGLIDRDNKEIKELEKSASFYQGKIDDLERNKETSEKYNDIIERLKAKKAEVGKWRANIEAINFNINLLDKMWILCAFPSVLKEFQEKSSAFSREKRAQNDQFIKEQGKKEGKLEALNEITELVNGSSRLPWYLPNQETMEEMIHDHICKVCGRPAEEGSEAYNFMVEKLEEYKRNALIEAEAKKQKEIEQAVLFENSYIEEVHGISLNLSGYNETEIQGKATEIRDKVELAKTYSDKLKSAEADVAEMEEEKARVLIQAEGVSEDMLQKSFSDLRGFFVEKGKADSRCAELREKIKGNQGVYDGLKTQLDSLNPDKSQARIYKRVHEAFEHILNAFVGAKEKNLTMFLESLETRANEYLDRLNANDFHGIVKLIRTADDSAVIKLFSSNKTEIKKPSGSQKTTMYMSVLFAISDLTTLKREENYPLFFDAATSSFGDTKEEDFYNIIDSVNKQCIIVTKDFLRKGALRMDDINKLTCTVYRIKKAAGYNKDDLSTIRTTVEKIK